MEMSRSLKAIAILTLMMVFAVSCTKPEEPNNGGNNDIPEEPVVGLFSINDSTQVCFSPGNLQYQASTKTWRFAEHQWDYIGEDNANISETYDGWIDLFGWGTGDHPTDISHSDWPTYSIFVDWGVNPISNWNGVECQWRTLELMDWHHLLFIRDTNSGIRFAPATVNDVKGLVLLPDDWNASIYNLVDFNNQFNELEDNIISAQDWNTFERHGAIFMPNAGIRNGTTVMWLHDFGLYWIADPSNPIVYVYYVECDGGGNVYFANYCPRYDGLSVRLVRNAE